MLFLPIKVMATNYYETMEVGEIRDFDGLVQPGSTTGYLGIIDYTWTLDAGGNKVLSIKTRMSSYCRVEAIAEGTGCLTFQGNATVIGVGGSYPLLTKYFITVKRGEIKITKIEISPSSVSLKVGETKQLSKTITPSNATNTSVSWSSSNTSIATVSSSGLVTAKAAGSATITCKANDGSGVSATCSVSMSAADPIKVTSVSLNATSASLVVGDTKQLTATISPSNATDKSVTWSSSNSSVASVSSSGLVTAKARGTATITCKANDGSGRQATCSITVANVKNYSNFTVKTAEGVEVQYYVRNVADGVCEVTNPAIDKSTTGKVTIPEEVEGLKVTSIYGSAFRDCVGITSVSIPSTVTSIGYSAFEGCTGLTSVSLGNGVKELGSYAFSGCTSLATITGISQLESIGGNVFRGESYNTYIPWYNSLPDGLLYLGKVLYAYKGTMPDNTTVNVKEGTTQIAYAAFRSSKGLVGLSIPKSVKSIGNYIVDSCPNLSSISVAEGNEKYDSRGGCNAIVETAKNLIITGCKNTTFPSTVTAIGNDAFYGSGLTELIIPNTIDSIASYAFAYNHSLETVMIGKGTRKIMNNVFMGCDKLNSISVANANSYYDSRDNCNAIIEKTTDKLIAGCPSTVIPASVNAIDTDAFYNYSGIFSITIPDKVEKIGDYAFEYNYGLRSVTLGKNIKEIGKSAFYGCTALRVVRSLAESPADIDESVFRCYSSYEDSIYNNATLYVPIGSKVNYMTSIGWNKFKKIVEIASDVTVEGDVFTVPSVEGVPISYIVTDVTSKSCELIGVPSGAKGKVTIPATANGFKVTCIGRQAFYGNSIVRNVSEVVIPEGVKRINSYAFGYLPLTSVSLPNSLETIEGSAFAHIAIKSVNIPKGVKEITSNPFWGCTDLETISVDAGNSVYEVRNNCNGVVEKATNKLVIACKKTAIPNSVVQIGTFAYGGQSELSSITIPSSVEVIGSSAFSSTGLETITIPSSVNAINNYAFGRCEKLTSVISKIEKPFEIDSTAFYSRSEYSSAVGRTIYYFTDATLYVPKGTKSDYEHTPGWKMFKNIVEGEPSLEPSIKGDVNGDGQVNGTDLVALTNIILGKNAKTDAADVNGDGQVNGTDYVALVNIVLGRSQAPRRAASSASISIDPSFSIKAGETKEMVINLTNASDDITLVQFDLRLPNGLSLKQIGGEYDIDIAGRTTWRKHSLDANATNGIVRFLLASSSNATLEGTDGAIITMTITADNSFTGGDIQLENILLVTPVEKEIKQDTYTYSVGQSQPLTPTSTGLVVEPFNITAGGEAEMVIDLTNPDDEITLVQFDLRLPNGLSLKQTGAEYDIDIAGRTTWRKHSLDANATNGIIRFLLASSSNATLEGTQGAVIRMTLKADNSFTGGTVKLENILLVTPAEKEIKPGDVSYTIGSTGIHTIVTDGTKTDAPIYNLSGQRLTAPQKGINIINGKKVMVK